MSNDIQSDRVIDRLLAERKEAESRLQPAPKTDEEVKDEIRQRVPVGLRRDPDIVSLVESGNGKIPNEFLDELVGVKLRQGL